MNSGKLSHFDVFSTTDLEERSRKRVPKFVFDFIEGGAEGELALRRNREAFQRSVLSPRIGVTPSEHAMTEVLGELYAAPIGIAPIGLAELVAPFADLALAKAAAKGNLAYVCSAAAGTNVDDIAKKTGRMPWFQLYIPRKAGTAAIMLRRIAEVGVRNLVVTVDVPRPGRRLRDLRNGLQLPLISSRRLVWQALRSPQWTIRRILAGRIDFPNFHDLEELPGRSFHEVMAEQSGGKQDWSALRCLRDSWKGKVLLKGVLHPKDAERAHDVGFDGIIVSNHGGRQFDAAPAALDALPLIRSAVPHLPVMLDSGVRNGIDVVHAMHAGADFVFIGRPLLHALAAFGADGPTMLVEHLIEEANHALALSGYGSWAALRAACVSVT